MEVVLALLDVHVRQRRGGEWRSCRMQPALRAHTRRDPALRSPGLSCSPLSVGRHGRHEVGLPGRPLLR
eukprot:6255660-Prymnesium_polylepis.1